MQIIQNYFEQLNQYIELLNREGKEESTTLSVLKERNENLYLPFLLRNYGTSFANPDYCQQSMGEMGPLLSAVFSQLLWLKTLQYHNDPFVSDFKDYLSTFQKLWQNNQLNKDTIAEQIITFSSELQRFNLEHRINWNYCAPDSRYMQIIMNSDLLDETYLYKLNFYVTDNERKLSAHVGTLPQEQINQIAKQFFDAFMRAYPRNNLQRAGRRGMVIMAVAGLERITKALILEIQQAGFNPFITDIRSTEYNPQFLYDHKEDEAIYLSDAHWALYMDQLKECIEVHESMLRDYSGTYHFTSFGESLFSPKVCEARIAFSAEQNLLRQKMTRAFFSERETVIPEENRNFSIIGFPKPEIHADFEAVFDAFIEINNLSNDVYEEIQQHICDALDYGSHAHVLGCNGNRTDIKINLHTLQDAEKQTRFFNCGADANIPVGEVFTSPTLKGTNGLLHMKFAYLDELMYKDLELYFEDGYVVDYSCANFEDEEKNREYIHQNLLESYEKVPMGEFAIGTNTLAYAISKKYGIVEKLNALFIEKMGPHFALGDTCYSMIEDIEVHNPDGKEIIARENEVSALRKENMDQAYLDMHTDITIPFEDVGEISVVSEKDEKIEIIRDGRFVLEGTEKLNEHLDKYKLD